MNKLLRDCVGSSLVEFTFVFPVVILALLGTVDVSFMLYDWTMANKAAYVGAHRAIVSDPVVLTNPPINDLSSVYDPFYLGELCTLGHCPSVPSGVCTGGSGAGCSQTAFNYIFNEMQKVFPRLQPGNVTITYQRNNNLGFVGRPGGLPMEVTVSISPPMTTKFYFIGPLMGFFGGGFSATKQIPPYATTLIGEDLAGTIDAP